KPFVTLVVGALLDLLAQSRKFERAEGPAMRLQRMCRPSQLLRVPVLDRTPHRREQLPGIGDERVDHLGKELRVVADNAPQVVQSRLIQLNRSCHIGAHASSFRLSSFLPANPFPSTPMRIDLPT